MLLRIVLCNKNAKQLYRHCHRQDIFLYGRRDELLPASADGIPTHQPAGPVDLEKVRRDLRKSLGFNAQQILSKRDDSWRLVTLERFVAFPPRSPTITLRYLRWLCSVAYS